ncbi:MAG: M20 family metallopeptidase [Halobacteriales archaeon]|nr:M20 family metallopeptidase [Halobacteriales archaeon]
MDTDASIEPSTDESAAADLLADLVAIDTQNPPGKEAACTEFIYETLTEWGVDSRRIEEPFTERPQVIAAIGEGEPDAGTLVLNGHIDVVPPGDPEKWTDDPFSGTIRDGRVYGRGASDMKSGVAAAMLAAKAVADADRTLAGELVLTFAVGEETAEPGTKRLLEEPEAADADYGIVLEPTELVVDTAGKGLAWYTLTVDGESCHASRPHLGKNALGGILSLDGPIAEYQDRIADRTHELLGTSLCTPTMAAAGEKENIVPDHAELRFDRRFLPSEDVETLDVEMDDLAASLRDDGFEVTVERTRTYEAAEIPTDATIASVIREHAAAVAGVETAPHGKEAATDQRNFVNDAGIPAIIWGPGTPAQSHTVDEWARTDLLYQSVDVLCRSLDTLCGVRE